MDVIVLETLLRGIAIGALAGIAMGLWRGGAGKPAQIAGVLFCIGAIAFTINSWAPLLQAFGWARPIIHFFAFGGVGLSWLFVVALFEDRRISLRTLAPWLLLTGIGIGAQFIPWSARRPVWIVHNLIEAAFTLTALAIIVRSWRGDLVEARRRLRGPFMAAVTMFTLSLSGFEIAEILGARILWGSMAGAFALAAFSVAGAIAFLEARPELFGVAQPAGTAPAESANPADRAALAKLEGAMGAGEAWRREGLTIGELAHEVGVPEHRLRRLINDGLGHRNFAAFVNARRIDEAKRRLRAPEHANASVSTIAFDLGFGSLGPFNRAFKDATGVTPSEWRKSPSPNP